MGADEPRPVGPSGRDSAPETGYASGYRRLLDGVGEAVLVFAGDARYLDANAAACALLGFSLDELRGLPPGTLMDRAGGEAWARLVAEGRWQGEVELRVKGGGAIWVALVTSRVELPEGTVYVSTLRDVTRRRAVEEELRLSQERYRDLIENSADLIGLHDLEGTILSVNHALVIFLGYERTDEIVGRNLQEFLVPEVRRLFPAYLAQVAQEGAARGLMRVQTPAGVVRVIEYNNSLRSEGPEEPIVRCMGRDVTERLEMEGRLRESEARFRTLSAFAPIGIFLADAAGRCIYTNPRWQQITGLNFEQSLGKGWVEAIDADERALVLEEWEDAARRGRELGREFRVRRPDGELRWVALRVAPVIGAGDTVTGFVGAVGDITDQREVEVALRESELRATRLQTTAEVGLTVAHELTQPLSILMGYLELLRSRRLGQDETNRYYAEMEKAAGDLAEKIRVIQGLRDYITKTYGPGMTVVDLERSGS